MKIGEGKVGTNLGKSVDNIKGGPDKFLNLTTDDNEKPITADELKNSEPVESGEQYFFLITWKQFDERRLVDKSVIVKSSNGIDSMQRMKVLNAKNRLTTTEYSYHNLSQLFLDNGLNVNEITKN